jgi:Bacteriophage head to tail connecting protein
MIPTPALQNGPGAGYTNDRIEAILARAEKAAAVRLQWQPLFQDCYDYALPRRQSFYSSTEGNRRTDAIFDSTAITGTVEFASRLQAYVMPIYAKWADLVSGDQIPPAARSQVDEALEDVTNYIFATIQNSSFDQQVHESMLEVAVGTGCLVVDDGTADRPLKFEALPLTAFTLETGVDGGTGAVFRDRRIKWREIRAYYPHAELKPEHEQKIAAQPDEEVDVVEATMRDYLFAAERWDHSVILKADKHEIYGGMFEGEGSCPYIVYHWSKAAGETYGRGPIQNALPDIKVLNLVTEMVLENAELAIGGLWQGEDDGVMNPDTISLAPRTVIPIARGSQGLQPLQPATKFDVAQFVMADMRSAIKKALYDEPLGSMQDTRIQTAQEVVERTADLSRRIGSSFGRLQAELVQPLLKRIVYLLRRQGRIQLPSINGRVVRVRPVTPLARTQAQEDVLRFDRLAEIIQARFGPAAVNTMLRGEEASPFLAENMGVPRRLIRSAREQQAILAAAQAQMLQAGAEPADAAEAVK